MAVVASTIFSRVSEALQDANGVTWTTDQLISWMNEAQSIICDLAPTSTSTTISVLLSAGTKQTTPEDSRRLIKVVRNMGADGDTPGRAVSKVHGATLDQNDPNWHGATASTEVKGYVFDFNDDPLTYYVTPPSDGTNYLEIVYSAEPTSITSEDDPISVPDRYSAYLFEWLMYKCLSRDSVDTPNYQRGQAHKQTFFNMMGGKIGIDQRFEPKIGGDEV
jgi:hypothetical protein